VVLPTGAGKSLCYQLPARIVNEVSVARVARAESAESQVRGEQAMRGLTVVVVPLLSLLREQLERCRQAKLRAEALHGGQQKTETARIAALLRSGDLDLIITTPETLLSVRAAKLLADSEIAHFVVDEAHCVCEWGKSFRPAYLKLQQFVEAAQIRCLTAFTATAGPRVIEAVRSTVFSSRTPALVAGNPDRPNIRYTVIPTLCKARALEQIVRRSPRPLLVFSRTRSSAENAARELRRRLPHLKSYFYHAGLDRGERSEIESWFMGSTDGVLAATSAYGMGIDKQNIRIVVHLDIPYSLESYLQETGRAGRDGKQVEAVLLYSAADLDFARRLDDQVAVERYTKILGYTLNKSRCRREQLLEHLGLDEVACAGCDVCDGRVVHQPEGAEQILGFVSRNRRRFTLRQIVHALRGEKSYEVVRRHLASYRGFGLLAGWEAEDIESALESLCRAGKIKVLKRGFWRQRITAISSVDLQNPD